MMKLHHGMQNLATGGHFITIGGFFVIPQSEKLSHSVREMAKLLGIGMNSAYALTHREDFPAIWISPRKCIIPADGLREWLNREGGRANG
jgi:hypothetical protein